MQYLKIITFILSSFFFAFAQADTQTLWQLDISQKSAKAASIGQHYRLDPSQMRQQLLTAPLESQSSNASSEIFLPVASGGVERFTLQESPVMQSGLASRYPDIKTYKVYGLDDPEVSGRISLSPAGFHGMITGPTGTFYIDPQGNDLYHAFRKRDTDNSHPFNCGVEGHDHETPVGQTANRGLAQRTAGNLRVYRTAIAGTVEYVSAVGGKTAAMSSVTNTINRINQIYERDLAVRLVLVNNTDLLFFEGDVNSDPYSNGASGTMLSENQNEITATIGAANYDIGHVFGRGGGGVARLGAVCSDSIKSQGVSNGFNFSGDGFSIDLVAHEIGHQFSASHSFNGTTSNCVNRSGNSAVEPGSGSSIMAYSGICGSEDFQNRSDAMFHANSINAIDAFTTSGRGANCGTLLSINNPNEPVADAGIDYTIPISTPFVLTANGTDADGDSLSYTWDQMDKGSSTNAGTFGSDLGDNPLMRSYLPRSTKSRYFPKLKTVIDGGSEKAETLPTTDRTLNFRVSIRDGKSGMGRDNVTITAENNAGPFTVTSHTSTASLSGGDSQNITWNVANTDQSPVSCAGVDIDLLLLNNSKQNYCVERLASATPNDGSATITLPDVSAARARFRVSCSDNVFYALSEADLQLTGASGASTNCNSVTTESEEQGGSNSAPVLSIDTPTDNSSFLQGIGINFTGSANDNEDGDISADIAWVSNMDGNLGNGKNIVATLTIGTHRITASIVDSDNATDSNSIFVTVMTPTPPPVVTPPVVDPPDITPPIDGDNSSGSSSGSGGSGSFGFYWLLILMTIWLGTKSKPAKSII